MRASVRRTLLAWFGRQARDLPWRRTRNPYHIWLAEIMLQQTRVDTVLPYYRRFLAAFPNATRLAAAPLQDVLKRWQGLGYYGRARNLHRAARIIVHERGGRLPATAAEWQELPGIGRYTANAIASIALREPVPVVDGNVQRVLARLFAIRACIDLSTTRARLWQLADRLLARKSPGAFNQALMELGARVCTPRRPRCDECPLRSGCAAYAAGTPERWPRRRAKQPSPLINMVAALIEEQGRLLLVRRPPTGLLADLWTLPGGEVTDAQPPAEVLPARVREALGIEIVVGEQVALVRHEFSHRRWRVHVYVGRLAPGSPPVRLTKRVRWVARGRLRNYPLAALDQKVLQLAR